MSRITSLALIAMLTFSAAGQVGEKMTVEVVQVPVYVTSSDGRPVLGLTKESFQLFVDGHPQPIDYFDAVDFASAPAGAASVERPRRERRLYLLLFDLTFATPPTIQRAQHAAEQAVEHSNPATDFFAVATYSSTRGVYFLSPFLSDRVAVTRAIVTLKSSAANDPLGIALASAERAKWVSAMEQGGPASGADDDFAAIIAEAGKSGGGGDVAEILKGGQAAQDAVAMPQSRLIEYQVEGLGEAASRFRGLEGQKHLLVFTEGFDSTRVTDIRAKGSFGSATGQYLMGAPPNLDAHLIDIIKKMHETFVSAGVTLDSVDIKGIRHTFNDLENDALYMLSRGTGGRVIVNRNDLVEAVGTLMQAERVAYVLSFRQGERKRGRISVKVSGLPRGAQVSYREGFGYEHQDARLDSLQLADIVLNDVPQAGMSLNSGVNAVEGGEEVAVSFARAEVVPQLLDQSPNVDILFYVFDRRGVAVAFKAKRINFNDAARVTTGYLTLREPFELPAGRYTAKVLLQITGTRSMGFVRREFTVDQEH
jgi:VWFA-related protein